MTSLRQPKKEAGVKARRAQEDASAWEEAGSGENKVRGTVFAANFVSRNWYGGPAAAGGGRSCDCGLRSDRVGSGIVAGPRGRGYAAHYRSRLCRGQQSAAAVAVRRKRRGRVGA